MKKKIGNIMKRAAFALSAALFALTPVVGVYADGFGMTVAPMNQEVVLVPGDVLDASFKISSPNSRTEDVYYELSVEPFYIDENDQVAFGEHGDGGKIVDWISFKVPTEGKLSPNETKEVKFAIDVPVDAPAGGQYASIVVTIMSKTEKESGDGQENGSDNGSSATIKEIKRVAHLVYAEVAGNTIKKGEITDATVPSFLLSGNIAASSSVKNDGNVHGKAYYKLQVFPLFSGEEIYTNEEEPVSRTVFPGQTLYNEISWDKTPSIGIFNVVYTVEFEGSVAKVEKMVIKCPIWLLFIVIFAVIALCVWIFLMMNKRKKARE